LQITTEAHLTDVAFVVPGSTPGQTLVCATLGPMARNVSTLTLTMKALLCPLMFSLDPCVPPMPFDEKAG